MNAINKVAVFALVAALTVVSACGGSNVARLGKPIPKETTVTTAQAINAAPVDFEGRSVLVKGKITRECPAGCWFWIQDHTGEMYVDIKPSNLTIPQRVGSTITVLGTVVLESGKPHVIGSGLEL
jgi:uncharacterized protein YdeI (BOF family)